MYQVLQVYTSFSFFYNLLSMSFEVGQSRSRRRHLRVATFPQSFGLEQVSETSSPRPTGDLNKSSKSRRKNRTRLISPRLPRDPPNLQETSRLRLRNPRRLESPTGRQLVSMTVR